MAQSTGPAQLLVPQHPRTELNSWADGFGEGRQPAPWLPTLLPLTISSSHICHFSFPQNVQFVTNFSVAKGGFLKIASLISCFGIKKQ